LDNIKFKNWEGKVPQINKFGKHEAEKLFKKLCLKFLLSVNVTKKEFFDYILKNQCLIGNTSQNEKVWNKLKQVCPYLTNDTFIYLDFYGFGKIERIKFKDFVENIHNLWYPSVDDLTIFDDYCEWVVNIFHYGDVSFTLGNDLLLCNKYNLDSLKR